MTATSLFPVLYGDSGGDYPNNGERFVYFARGVLEAAHALGIEPDIVHAHDWQAGLVMAYLATVYESDPRFSRAGTIFTIHNLGYQGLFPRGVFSLTGIPPARFNWREMEFYGKVSFLKSGIVYADAVSTVSETYAEEITGPELGFGLDGIFTERRSDLYGIVNGIDTDIWNPAADTIIPAQYDLNDRSGKNACRRALLTDCGMSAGPDTPVFGMVSRLDDQKGLDIIEESVGRLVSMDLRIVILGTGTREHHEAMEKLEARFPGRIRAVLRFDNNLAHLIYAGLRCISHAEQVRTLRARTAHRAPVRRPAACTGHGRGSPTRCTISTPIRLAATDSPSRNTTPKRSPGPRYGR